MLLLVGLGNPGPRHARNRHNVGFRAAEAIHSRQAFGPWKRRFSAETSEATIEGRRCLLMKPLTFMNRSGEAVGEASRFYRIAPSDIVVIYDELDLPPGKVRLKQGGGTAGHNGIRSIGAHIGPEFRRLRIGIGHPGHKDLVHGYVLHDFSKTDEAWLAPLMQAVAEHLPLLVKGHDSTFSNRLHEALSVAGSNTAGDSGPRGDEDDISGERRSRWANGFRRLFDRRSAEGRD